MKAIAVILAPAFLLAYPAAAAELYRCSAKAVAVASDNGSIERPGKDPAFSTWGSFTVDTDTGQVRIGRLVNQRWTIVQKSTAENDFVAAPESGEGIAPLYLLRLATYTPVPTFIMVGMAEMTTGTCEAVR